MVDISHLAEKIFNNASASADLYMRGYIPVSDVDFGISFDGEYSVVPFHVSDFATREVYDRGNRKIRLDNWAKEGVEEINRFISIRDLSASLKKGDNIELFVEFPDNLNWKSDGVSHIPANALRKYSVY